MQHMMIVMHPLLILLASSIRLEALREAELLKSQAKQLQVGDAADEPMHAELHEEFDQEMARIGTTEVSATAGATNGNNGMRFSSLDFQCSYSSPF